MEYIDLHALTARILKSAQKKADAVEQYIDRETFIRIELTSEIYGLLLFSDKATRERMLERFPKEETE